MKKLIIAIITSLSFLLSVSAQTVTTCASIVNVEVIPLSPQSGSYNYFSVKVSLNQTYDQDVIVSGFIFDFGEENQNHPFELTVDHGSTIAQTSIYFYQTSPTSEAALQINSVTPFFVTNNNIYYSTQYVCGSFSNIFSEIGSFFNDSLSKAYNSITSFLTSDIDSVIEFLEYLDNNGIQATSSHFNIPADSIVSFSQLMANVDTLFWGLSEEYYGNLDSLTKNLRLVNY